MNVEELRYYNPKAQGFRDKRRPDMYNMYYIGEILAGEPLSCLFQAGAAPSESSVRVLDKSRLVLMYSKLNSSSRNETTPYYSTFKLTTGRR